MFKDQMKGFNVDGIGIFKKLKKNKWRIIRHWKRTEMNMSLTWVAMIKILVTLVRMPSNNTYLEKYCIQA